MVHRSLLCVVVLLAVGGVAITGAASGQVATEDGPTAQETPDNQTATADEPAADEPTADEPAAEDDALTALPDAVVEDGSLNLTALYETHSEVLRAEGYRVTENVTVARNGSVIHEFERTVISVGAENRTLTLRNATFGDRNVHTEVWMDGEARLVRMERNGNVTYRSLPAMSAGRPEDVPRGQPGEMGPENETEMEPDMDAEMKPHHGGMMGPHAAVPGHVLVRLDNATGEFTVTDESVAGVETEAGAVTVTAPIDADEPRYQATGNITLVISERGVVRAIRATAETAQGATVTYALTTQEVGVQNVSAPDWVSEARSQAIAQPEPDAEPSPEPDDGQGPGQSTEMRP